MINYIFIVFLLVNSIFFTSNANSESKFPIKNSLIENLLIEKLPHDFKELNFKKVGSAKFSVLFWDIYNSTLYTKSGSYLHNNSPDSLLFEIEYLRDITANDLVDRTVEQWEYLDIAETEYSQFIPTLKTIWPDISTGDKLTMLLQNNRSVFYFNDVRVGYIDAKEFSKLFLDIWLSPKTSEKKLRDKLLGETE